jgi:DNA polymerase III subunit epsilon
MVAGFGKFLFKKGSKSSANLTKDVRQTLEAWRADGGPALDEPHFHTRYVVVDVATSGEYPGSGKLEGITAIGMRGGVITPGDAFALDLAGGDADPAAVDRQLAAFLSFSAKAPLVTYHSVFVSSFLQRALQERLGVDFRPDWVDLAWLLPSLFAEKWHTVVPLDRWLELFGIQSEGWRDTMDNTLVLGRLFQMLLVRAIDKEILTAEKLVEESLATTFLRRTH